MTSKDRQIEEQRSASQSDRTLDQVDQGRRRLTQGLAGGIPVVMTLAHRPVWAADCSGSAVASANTSLNPGVQSCALGCSVAFWRGDGHVNPAGSREWYQAWQDCGVLPESSFAQVFGMNRNREQSSGPAALPGGSDFTLLEALSGSASTARVGGGNPASNSIVDQCMAQVTAAYLNASHPVLSDGFSVNGLRMYSRDMIADEFRRAYSSYQASLEGNGGGDHAHGSGNGRNDDVITGQSRISSRDPQAAFNGDIADTTALQELTEQLAEANDQACVLDARNYNPANFA